MYGVMRIRYIYEGKLAPEGIDVRASLVFAAVIAFIWVVTSANKAIWRFMSSDDVRSLFGAVVLASITTPVVLFLFFDRANHFPRSAPFIAGTLFFAALIVSRALVLFYTNGDIRALFRANLSDRPPAILIGKTQNLHNYLRDESKKNDENAYNIHGLIESDGGHKGRSIRGIPIIGNVADIAGAFANISRLHGAKPTLILIETKTDRKKAAELVKLASNLGAPLVRMKPGSSNSLTPFEAADLIGRKAKSLDMSPVQRMIEGKKVIITGAGGTIGSELTRQVAAFSPSHLTLLDASEMNLYTIESEISGTEDLSYSTYLGNVRDSTHMDEIFAKEKPEIILHAAALKHVPLMETNPIEALRTNIGGTKVMIDMAMKHQAESFTLISTDKAVSPKKRWSSYCNG